MKNVEGCSLDFLILNLVGFTFYSLYTIIGRIDPDVKVGYIDKQDIAYATHAFLITLVTLG